MIEVKNLLDGQQQGGLAAGLDGSNIVQFPGTSIEKAPPLTDAEIVALREVIRGYRAIATACPIARRAIGDEGT